MDNIHEPSRWLFQVSEGFQASEGNRKASKERQTNGTPRLLCDCLELPEKHEKITPVLQANILQTSSGFLHELRVSSRIEVLQDQV